ncbi:MAG: DNA primase [Oscillospiraceae bacterium]|jgi:DNA primase|nr:DNA primase [Oscillospiraceae bacterium]
MGFPERFLDELTVKTDMIALVSNYTQPVRRGTRWFARCPFHSEKTPSFTVTPESGLFYCFGCQAGGGPIQFVMRAENLEFADAVRFLAARLGLAVPEEDDGAFKVKRERLLEVNRMAARWYYETLSGEGERCAEYMRGRGMSPAFARRFGLGYAPDRWDGLMMALGARGVSNDELFHAGLASRGQKGGLYDAFRDRLMFPIFDLRGQVIGFSGRALSGEAAAKYKNSAESPVYQKRGVLYAAHLARKSEKPFWILCEGNVDVFMLHQAGYDNAVATCGTALTDMQARLIARHVSETVLAYDADAAGQNATGKASSLLEAAGVKVRVLRLRGAKDPDEFIRAYGSGAFDKLIMDSSNHTEYRLSLIEGKHPPDSDAEKLEYLREATLLLAGLPTQGERFVYGSRVAKRLGISEKAVLKDVDIAVAKRRRGAEKAEQAQTLRPRRQQNSAPLAEEKALAILFRRPELETELSAADFTNEETRQLFLARETPPHTMSAGTARLYAKLMAEHEGLDNDAAALKDCERRIKERALLAAGDVMAKYKRYKDTKTPKETRDGS